MLINLSEIIDKSSILSKPYRGIVMDNNDPLKLGRVKIRIEGLIDGATEYLPWCYPFNTSFIGGNSSSGVFAVPEVNSIMVVEFPYDDIYSPFYVGYWESSNTHTTAMDGDYPNSYGLKDSVGNKIIINKTSQTLEVTHSSGTVIKITQNGDIELTATGTIKLNGETGRVLTTASDPIVDNITGAPHQGVLKVKAG